MVLSETELRFLQNELGKRLPEQARWCILGTTWDWDFSRVRNPLKTLSAGEIGGWDPPIGSSELLIIGEERIAEGGGASPFATIHRGSGSVFGLDIERTSAPIYFLNSSVAHFIETFLLFDDVVGSCTSPATELATRFRAVEPKAFDKSDWRIAIDAIGFSGGESV